MIEHCASAFAKKQKELLYRYYVTDALKVINSKYELRSRFYDLYNKKPVRDDRTSEEIIADISAKLDAMG